MDNRPVILNNFEIFKALEKSNRMGTDSLILTENPLVFKISNDRSFRVRTLDPYLTSEEKIAIGAFASRLCTAWVSAINKYYEQTGIPLGQTLNNNLYYLANTVFYRALQLKRIFGELGTVKVPCFRNQTKYFFDQKYLPFSSQDNFFALLANHAPFREMAQVHPIDAEEDGGNNPFDKGYQVVRNIQWDNMIQYLLGISSFRTKLASRILEKIIPREGADIKFFGFGKMKILIHQPNDLITWKIPTLFFKARFLRLHDRGLLHTEMTHRPGDDALVAKLSHLARESPFYALSSDEFGGATAFLAKRSCDFISTYLLPAYDMLKHKIASLCERGKLQGNACFFSGGLTEPAQSLISLLYSSCGVPTVGFQEGGATLLKLYRDMVPHGHISCGDAFVSYHENEEVYFKKRTGLKERPFFIMGTQKLLRAPFPRLSSLLAKITWKIPLKQRTILYVPTKFQGEVILPAYQASSLDYWELQKCLVSHVFPKANGKIIIKLRKKGLITTENKNLHPLQLLDLPHNIELKSDPDLRYIRYTADLLIVDYATSTLGWALATGKPTVYLHYRKTPLEDEVRELMKESLFLIDIEDGIEGWEEDLLSVLNRDKKSLLEDWRAKAKKRALFLEKYVWGRETSNKSFIDWLTNLKRRVSAGDLKAA